MGPRVAAVWILARNYNKMKRPPKQGAEAWNLDSSKQLAKNSHDDICINNLFR